LSGYDEYDTAPPDQFDEEAIYNAGSADAFDDEGTGVDLTDLSF
jgi:hypothetical protein